MPAHTSTRSQQRLTLPSPAKLNLFLHITGRRADGYHELQTIFQFIDYGDELSFELTDDGSIDIAPAIAGVALSDNLIYKAARMVQQACGTSHGVRVGLNKILPMGGGLGGGSSNAATTLLAVNHLWGANLSLDTLAEMGLKLGADVPVFVRGEACWAEGVGEKITPIKDLAENWFVVVVPDCHVDTREIFSNKELTRDTEKCRISAALRGEGRNDCEAVVSKLYKEVAKSLNLLNNFGSARMTGTGACCFLEVQSKDQANTVLAQLPAESKAFVARGINHSPLHTALNSQVKK